MDATWRYRSLAGVLGLVLGTLCLSGCSDLPVAPEPAREGTQEVDLGPDKTTGLSIAERVKRLQRLSKKMRHLHLLEQAMVQAGPGKTAATSDSVRLILGFSNGSETADSVLSVVLDKYKILNRFEYKTAIKGMALTVPSENLETLTVELENSAAVSWMEPDAAVPVTATPVTSTPASTQQIPWSIPAVGADLSWTVSGDGNGSVDVDLYVVDTGVDHTDLNIVECIEYPSRKGGGIPCVSTLDPDGHGTETAGIAAAMDNLAGIVGVSPGARVHAVKVMKENGNTNLGSLIAVVDDLTRRKLASPTVPMVVNISLGANVRTARYNGLDEAIRTSIAAGVVYVIAAGNAGIDASTVSPAHVLEAITVGAHAQDLTHAAFSNFGAVIDLLAPGVDIQTLSNTNELSTSSGTSLAAPHVAGAAALLLAQNASLSPQQVRDLLLGNASPVVTNVPLKTTNLSLRVQ